MITHNDQLNFFRLIAGKLEKDIVCYAFGGTAMMFYGYKDETKDIDILFLNNKDRQSFVRAAKKLGFEESDPIRIYVPEKLKEKNKPLVLKREDYRLDLFERRIFGSQLSPKMKQDFYALHEFKEKYTLKIYVMRKEHIVMLKTVTERQNDFDDILDILSKEKRFDWQYLIDEAVWQHNNGDDWILLDLEKTMRELLKYMMIEEKYFEQIYKEQRQKSKNFK